MEIKQAWRLEIRTWRREVLQPLWSHLKRSAREGREPFYPLTAAVLSPQHTHTLSSRGAQLTRGQWSSCCLLNTHTYACCMHAHTQTNWSALCCAVNNQIMLLREGKGCLLLCGWLLVPSSAPPDPDPRHSRATMHVVRL